MRYDRFFWLIFAFYGFAMLFTATTLWAAVGNVLFLCVPGLGLIIIATKRLGDIDSQEDVKCCDGTYRVAVYCNNCGHNFTKEVKNGVEVEAGQLYASGASLLLYDTAVGTYVNYITGRHQDTASYIRCPNCMCKNVSKDLRSDD
jgi:hypothetical protein